MKFQFAFPDVGEGLAEGKIIECKMKQGDRVRQGDVIAVVETDKVVTDLPSPRDGVLVEISVKEGQTVKVGQVIAVIEMEDGGQAENTSSVVGRLEKTAGIALEASVEGNSNGTSSGSQPRRGNALASPVARKLAASSGVDIGLLQGTGPGGRVLKKDVAAAAVGRRTGKTSGERKPLSTLRKTITANMEESQTIPSTAVYDFTTVDELVKVRAELAVEAGRKAGFLSFFVKAAALALGEYPLLNSFYYPDTLEYEVHETAHIGIAVDTEEGLVVPVIRDAAGLSILGIQEKIDLLAEKAKNRTFAVSDLRGGTFTISNYGAFAGLYGRPMILPPQTGILGIGRIHQAPVVREGAIVAASILPLSLAFDHRMIDGMYALRFLSRFMTLVSSPLVLLAG